MDCVRLPLPGRNESCYAARDEQHYSRKQEQWDVCFGVHYACAEKVGKDIRQIICGIIWCVCHFPVPPFVSINTKRPINLRSLYVL